MSYILDALRKSEQQRRPGAASRPSGAVHNVSIPMPGGGWLLLIGFILLVGILTAAFFFWRNTVNSVAVLVPEPASVSTASAQIVETLPATTIEKNVATPAESATAPLSAKNESSVGDLADEAQVPVRTKPKAKLKSKSVTKHPAAKAVTTSALAPQKNIPATPIASDHTPLLQQMPQEFQRALPPLAVSIHVYSQDAAQRILFINNREYHVGDKINGSVRVEEIVPDGTVLSYQGERFKIGRPR